MVIPLGFEPKTHSLEGYLCINVTCLLLDVYKNTILTTCVLWVKNHPC